MCCEAEESQMVAVCTDCTAAPLPLPCKGNQNGQFLLRHQMALGSGQQGSTAPEKVCQHSAFMVLHL